MLFFRLNDAGRYNFGGITNLTSFMIRRNGVSLYQSHNANLPADTGTWLAMGGSGPGVPTVTFVWVSQE